MKTKPNDDEREQDVSFLTPDFDRLPEEWILQPKLYWQNAEKLERLKAARDRAKAEFELVEAETAQAVRSNPQEYGHEKVTESCVKELVPMQEKYKRAYTHLIETQEAVGVAQVLVNALDQKKYALQDGVRLTLANFYASPKVDEESDGGEMEKVCRDGAFKRRNKKER